MFEKLESRELFFLCIFGMAVAYTVGAYGSAQGGHGSGSLHCRETARMLIGISSLMGVLFLPGRNVMPKVNLKFIIPMLILLVWALFMFLNAKYDIRLGEWILRENQGRPFKNAPGSFARTTSQGYFYELLALFVFVLMIARSVETQAWKLVLACFAIAGTMVALVGIGHRILGIDSPWGVEGLHKPKTFFAPFVYGANAGSFMNLSVLVSLAFSLDNQYRRQPKRMYFWVICAALAVVGIVFSASKAGFILLVLQVIGYVVIERKQMMRLAREFWESFPAMSLEKKIGLGVGISLFLFFVLTGATMLMSRVDVFLGAWEKNGQSNTIEGRFELMEIMWLLLKTPGEASWHGFGPGAFGHIMIWYLPKDNIVGFSDFGLCDPLQTLVEWGYLGSACWFFIGGGALVRGIYLLRKDRLHRHQRFYVKALCLSLMGVGIHSFFDFPLSIFSIHVVAMGMCAVLWSLPVKKGELLSEAAA